MGCMKIGGVLEAVQLFEANSYTHVNEVSYTGMVILAP